MISKFCRHFFPTIPCIILENLRLNQFLKTLDKINKISTQTHLQPVQIHPVLLQHRRSVMHYPRARHHPRARPDVGHGERKLELRGTVRRNADLYGAGPFGNHTVQTDLEKFAGFYGTRGQDDPVVEVVGGVGTVCRATVVNHLDFFKIVKF